MNRLLPRALDTESGKVTLRIVTLTVNGRQLPAQILDAIRQHNLVENIEENREAAEYLRSMETLTIEGGQLRVSFKP